MNPALRKEPSYDVSKFSAIVHTGTLQQLMLANLATPGNSMKEVFAAAKAKPGSITVGTFGGINLASLFVGWAKAELGVEFYPIPYKSATQGAQASLAGDVNIVSFAAGPGAKMVQSGKMKALAVTSRERDPSLPNVPTFAEAGMPAFDVGTTFGLLAAAGTPEAVIARLHAEFTSALRDPDLRRKIEDALEGMARTGDDVRLAGFALLASPAFTGVPTAPTAAFLTNTTQIATTAYASATVSTASAGAATAITAETARAIASGIRASGGILSEKDLAQYSAVVREPMESADILRRLLRSGPRGQQYSR